MILGAHRATTGGLHHAIASGLDIGCDGIQLFTTSPRQWKARPLTDEALARWHECWGECGLQAAVAHDSYLINLAAPDEALREKSRVAFGEELERCAALGIPYLVTHPGCHVGAGEEAGLTTFAEALRRVYDEHPDAAVTTLLETTAGQGTSLGWRFEHLRDLLAELDLPDRIGVCVDTCHVFAAGYDIRDDGSYEATVAELASTVGLEAVKVIHLNDSKGALGSRVDRHEEIGQGQIGAHGFRRFVTDPRLAGRPMLIETPGLQHHARNLERLRALASGHDYERWQDGDDDGGPGADQP